MAKQVITIGTVENDGTGDNLRTMATKCNANFTELYDAIALTAVGKYSGTVNLVAETEVQKVTLIAAAAEIYSVFITDATNVPLQVQYDLEVVGAYWAVNIYSTDSLTGVKIKILF